MNKEYILKNNQSQLKDEQIRLMKISKESVWTGYVFITDEKWKTYKMKQASKKIQEWNIQQMLWLDYNKAKNIITQIECIQFPKLLRLSINSNAIQSIQNLCRIYLPSLKYIYLQNNFIKSIKLLKKCKFAKLLTIGVSGNPLTDCDKLYQNNFSQKMEQLTLEIGNSRQVSPYLNWLIKLNPFSIQRIYITSKSRIKQKGFLTFLEKQRKILCIQT